MLKVGLRAIVACVLIFGMYACQNEAADKIPTPQMADSSSTVMPVYYRGEEVARTHHCITHDPPIHQGFWELTYASANHAVGRVYGLPYVDANGNRVEGGYLDPANIESIKIGNASFGELRWGRRVLSLFLLIWVSGWQKFPDGGDGGFVYHSAEGYMDDETCEITYFRSW